jgi:hypothetical protein
MKKSVGQRPQGTPHATLSTSLPYIFNFPSNGWHEESEIYFPILQAYATDHHRPERTLDPIIHR